MSEAETRVCEGRAWFLGEGFPTQGEFHTDERDTTTPKRAIGSTSELVWRFDPLERHKPLRGIRKVLTFLVKETFRASPVHVGRGVARRVVRPSP